MLIRLFVWMHTSACLCVREKERSSLVSKHGLKMDDDTLFTRSEIATLDPRSKVISPPQSATLTTPHQPCSSKTKTKENHQEKKNESEGPSEEKLNLSLKKESKKKEG